MVGVCTFGNGIDNLVEVCAVEARQQLERSDHSLFVVYRKLRKLLQFLSLIDRNWFWIFKSCPDPSIVHRGLNLLKMLVNDI
jgi:hypothetical protein